MDFYLALSQFNAQSASQIITPSGLCRSTYTIFTRTDATALIQATALNQEQR